MSFRKPRTPAKIAADCHARMEFCIDVAVLYGVSLAEAAAQIWPRTPNLANGTLDDLIEAGCEIHYDGNGSGGLWHSHSIMYQRAGRTA